MESFHGIGIMSGTSLDGLDLASCTFHLKDGHWTYSIEKAETIPYDIAWKDRLRMLHEADQEAIHAADLELGAYIGHAVRNFIRQHKINVAFIASHGHTVLHDPSAGLTLQIGSGNQMAELCGIPVINDFRSQDIQMGGQGAPLVPIGDKLLFSEFEYCLNIGGIANISYEEDGERIAFDICPANMVLNILAEQAAMPFDDKGRMAEKGNIIPELLEKLESNPYYKRSGPRSLGREWVEEHIFPLLKLYADRSINDLLATFTEHIALRISAIAQGKDHRMLVTGGGAYNDFLISRTRQGSGVDIHLPDELLIEYKEAMIFSFLGVLRLLGINNVLGTVTGAGKNHCSGHIIYP